MHRRGLLQNDTFQNDTFQNDTIFNGRFLVAWSFPLTIFAVFFFPSDTERWIFILPAAALFLGPICNRQGLYILAAIALVNISFAIPDAIDRSPIEKAKCVEHLSHPSDLIVSPGNGWDELIGLFTSKPPHRFPFIYYVGAARGLKPAFFRMRDEIERTFDNGGRVFVARLVDKKDPRGFKELRWFGLTREGFVRLFTPFSPRKIGKCGLWELRARAQINR